MRGALAGAWLFATGLVIWRQASGGAHIPVPGALLAVTGLYAGLGAVASLAPVSAPFITVTAWGLNVAGVLNLWPAGLGAQTQAAAAAGSGGKPATPTNATL